MYLVLAPACERVEGSPQRRRVAPRWLPSGYPLQVGRAARRPAAAGCGWSSGSSRSRTTSCSPSLWIAFVVLTVVAFFAILFTGRYPRAIFDFNVGVLRWTWRVGFYSYGALAPTATRRSRSPTCRATRRGSTSHTRATLSRGLVLVKWWLLALPQYLIVGVFAGGAWAGFNAANDDAGWTSGGGLIGLLVCIAGIVLLVTGRYPKAIFDFVMGMNAGATASPPTRC